MKFQKDSNVNTKMPKTSKNFYLMKINIFDA